MARMTGNSGESEGGKRGVSWTRRAITAAVLGVLLLFVYLIMAGKVASYRAASDSMAPAVRTGETWLLTPPSGGTYRVGDIVVFDHAGNSDARLAKRIVAIGPAQVSLKGGRLFVNDQPSPPPQGAEEPVNLPDKTWDVAPGEVFVAGDNRAESLDSRDYGPISVNSLRGVLARKL